MVAPAPAAAPSPAAPAAPQGADKAAAPEFLPPPPKSDTPQPEATPAGPPATQGALDGGVLDSAPGVGGPSPLKVGQVTPAADPAKPLVVTPQGVTGGPLGAAAAVPGASSVPGATPPTDPDLSPLHNEIAQEASKYPPKPGTEQWSTGKFISWKAGQTDIFQFKDQWVGGYKDAINAAAKKYDLPPSLVAGVAYNEVGGDPPFVDDLAYELRGKDGQDRTSFGDVSMQVRRGAETLGYGSTDKMTETQKNKLIESLKDPQTNIFMAAKHLSELRDVDFKGVAGKDLTKSQFEAVATRYNRGPAESLESINANPDYGRTITKRIDHINDLIR